MPYDLRERLLDILHFAHSGVTKMTAGQQRFGGRTHGETLSKKSKVVQPALK